MHVDEKRKVVEELAERMRGAESMIVADYRGLTVTQIADVRGALREAGASFRVAKNTLAKRASSASRYEKVAPMLQGPMALILGFEDPVVVAKLAVKFADELPKLEIKGAVLDGQVLPAAEVKALATLPSREVLMAQLLGLLQAPAARLLRTLNEPGAQLARLVDQIGKRAGAGESAAG